MKKTTQKKQSKRINVAFARAIVLKVFDNGLPSDTYEKIERLLLKGDFQKVSEFYIKRQCYLANLKHLTKKEIAKLETSDAMIGYREI